MTTTEAKPKKLIQITMSERRPLKVDPEEWPIIAQASDWWGGQVECQANEEAFIKVRQHADGRAIVYCVRGRGPGGMPIGYTARSGGFLVDGKDSDELVRAIRRCAGIVDSDELGDQCIADLPAEEL